MTPKEKQAAADRAAADKAKADADKLAADKLAADKAKADDLTALSGALQNLTTQMAAMGGRVDVLAQERTNRGEPAAPVARTFQRTVTLEQIDAAHDEGDSKRATRLQTKYNEESLHEALQGIGDKIAGLEQHGTSMIAQVVKQQVSAGLPYYTRFQKEIDEFLAKAPPSALAQPDMHKWAHDAIVGRHMPEIVAEAAEAAVRKHMDGGSGYVPNAGGSGDTKGEELTVESVYGEDAKSIKAFLKQNNKTIDSHARMRGFSNTQDYLAHVKAQREKEQKEAV